MVRITEPDFQARYEEIKREAIDGKLVVYVASDVDAICACKILHSLLVRDFVQHKLVPVACFKDLEKAVKDDPLTRVVVMLNCSGMMDLKQLFEDRDVKLYLIDNQRPLFLDYCSSTEHDIVVFDTQADNQKVQTYMEAHESTRLHDGDSSDQEDEEEEEEEDEDALPHRRRRLNDGQAKREYRRQRQRDARLLADYYNSGTYYTTSSAGQMYILADQLARTDNSLLWCAIVGIMSQYLFERMDTERYNDYVNLLNADVVRLNVPTQDGARSATDTLQKEDEYRFMLLHHWSLYDSMYHSGYVASKLAVWRDFGRRRLNNMFARMGFSLKQCQQVYTHTESDLQTSLRQKVESVAPLYGLTDIIFPSFSKSFGYKHLFTASDAAYSIATLLEATPETASRLGEKAHWNAEDDLQALRTDSLDVGEGLHSARRPWWMRNFYMAYDAVDISEGLLHGITLCKKLQKAIVRQGTAIVDNKLAKSSLKFRNIVMRDGPDLHLFQHPITLTKLALYLTDIYREHGNRNLPIVLSSLDAENGSYLVIAHAPAPMFGSTQKNRFGIAFQEAAEKSKARVSFDSFDPSVVQVHADDIEKFLQNIKLRHVH